MDITATLKINKINLRTNTHIHILKYSSQCAQIQLPQFLLFYTSEKNMTGTRQII